MNCATCWQTGFVPPSTDINRVRCRDCYWASGKGMTDDRWIVCKEAQYTKYPLGVYASREYAIMCAKDVERVCGKFQKKEEFVDFVKVKCGDCRFAVEQEWGFVCKCTASQVVQLYERIGFPGDFRSITWLHRCDFFGPKEPPKVKCGECKYGSLFPYEIRGLLTDKVVECWWVSEGDGSDQFFLAPYEHPCEKFVAKKVVKDA